MKKEISLKKDSDVATRGDVKEIVTEVVSAAFEHFTIHVLPPLVEGIVYRVVSEVVDKIVDERIERFAMVVERSFRQIEAQMVTKDEFYPFKEATEQSFYYLQTDVTDLKTRMGRVENRLDKVEGRLDSIDVCIRVLDNKFDDMSDMYYGHDTRLLRLEQKTPAMA